MKESLLFLGILLALSKVSHLSKQTTGNVYHGRYTRDIRDSELLIPRRVFEDGSFNSYSLPNFYDRRDITERKRRSASGGLKADQEELEEDEEEEEEDDDEGEDKLHLVLPFNGIDHHVELSPYHEFISPDMVIETRGSGIRGNLNEALRFKRVPDQQCHYRGIVRDHADSRAALSLCDGVVGYVQTNHGRYFIEPANEAEPGPDGRHVHVAYKRDAPHENTDSSAGPKGRCGTTDNWEAAWAEQLAKRQRRLAESNSLETKRAAAETSGTHSIHRFIEIGLVADRRFLDFHNNTNYEQYLLTIMNMASDFYHDASSGNQIDVVVVRIIYLEKEKEEIDLMISPAAEDTLASFAKWADKMNPPDSLHPNHHDIAVLVTRHDICSEGTNCDLMGLAYVAAACDPPKAACINEDSGLLLGIVVAHEVGHVMGCSHDEIETSGCPSQDKDESYFIMSPIVFIYTIRWSSCSRKYITTFLESGLGECLNDDPKNPPDKYQYPNMLPGAMYDADFQCQMELPGSKLCPKSSANACESLWCLTNSSCYSLGSPMADGTKCGENKWCIHMKCVDMGSRPAAVNGGWGEWGPMGACTRTCGGGVKYSERECDNPVPANGGRYCIGERKRIATCNTAPCDPSKPSYRALQCAEYDGKQVLTDGPHQWKPYADPKRDQCALYCVNEKRTFVKLRPAVNDSTPCKPGTNYMCITGTCRKVGCDWVIDSEAIEDKCGVCKGDGTKCSPVEGLYTKTVQRFAYEKIVTVPKGARSIHVVEEKPSENVLAVKFEKNETYCLNANQREQKSGDYECAGTMIIYSHPEPDREEIEMKGPISEDIQLQYAFFQPKSNPGIRYRYYVMSTNGSYTPKYTWDFVEWSTCTVKCGGGTEISEPSCVEERAGKVSPSFCEGTPKPQPKTRVCNKDLCPAKWRVSQWSKCSACDGKQGTRRRKVQCVKPGARPGQDDVQANLDACKGRVPKQKENCVGTRPCKKKCIKSRRQADRPTDNDGRLTAEERGRMIDRLVDLGLERYLAKEHQGKEHGDNSFARTMDAEEFRRNYGGKREEKRKRTCTTQDTTEFSTPRPGSIVKDSVPREKVVLMQAPYTEELFQSNFSDKAFRESGGIRGAGIDTSREKVFKGDEAVRMLEKLTNRNSTN